MFGMIDGEHTILDGNYDYLKPYYDIILDEQEMAYVRIMQP